MGNRDRICGKSGKGSSPEDSIQFPIQRNPENWRSFAFVFWDWLYVVWFATLTAGCLVRGIITISGRSSSYDRDYWFAGVVFLLWACGNELCGIHQRKCRKNNISVGK
jgi:hypothetical protein